MVLSYRMIFMSEYTCGLFRNAANLRLIPELEERKLPVLLFPEFAASPLQPVLGAVDLSQFDWVIFPDLYSVDFFVGQMTDKFALDELRVCAFGEAVADRLRFSKIHADVIPARIDDEAVFSAINSYRSPEDRHFLIPKESGRLIPLASLLEEASVTEVPVYSVTEPADITRFRSLLLGGAVDEFIFTTPQDVFDLARYADLPSINIQMSAADETTFQTLREFGIKPRFYQR